MKTMKELKQEIEEEATYWRGYHGNCEHAINVFAKSVLGLLDDYIIVKKPNKVALEHLKQVSIAILGEDYVCIPKKQLQDPAFLEKLAELEHEQWKHWMDFQLEECAIDEETMSQEECEAAGEKWEAWSDLADIPYSELTEEQKESDREWARKVLALFRVEVKK